MTDKKLPARRGSTDVAAPASASSAPSVAIGRHLAPLRELREIEQQWVPVLRRFARGIDAWPGDSDVPEGFLDAMRRDRNALPPAADRRAVRQTLRKAHDAEATQSELARVIGALFDGFSTFDPGRTPGAVDAFLMCCEIALADVSTSPIALSLAAVDALRTERWAPTPGDFLDRVRAAERRVGSAVRALEAVERALPRLAELEAANTPAARAARRAEEEAVVERRRVFAEKLRTEFPRLCAIGTDQDPAA